MIRRRRRHRLGARRRLTGRRGPRSPSPGRRRTAGQASGASAARAGLRPGPSWPAPSWRAPSSRLPEPSWRAPSCRRGRLLGGRPSWPARLGGGLLRAGAFLAARPSWPGPSWRRAPVSRSPGTRRGRAGVLRRRGRGRRRAVGGAAGRAAARPHGGATPVARRGVAAGVGEVAVSLGVDERRARSTAWTATPSRTSSPSRRNSRRLTATRLMPEAPARQGLWPAGHDRRGLGSALTPAAGFRQHGAMRLHIAGLLLT